MKLDFESFLAHDMKVPVKHREQAEKVFELLTTPENICKMVIAANMGIPSLTPVVKDIESCVDCQDTYLRQTVGREICYIMKMMGYVKTDDTRARLRNFSESKWFRTGQTYKFLGNAKYKVVMTLRENE